MDVNNDCAASSLDILSPQPIHFQRRDCLQLPKTGFWQIEGGFIVASIVSADGNLVPLGIWSTGDLLGYPLAHHTPLEIESITQTTVLPILKPAPELLLRQSLEQLRQTQILLTLRHGPIIQRIINLLVWLGEQFGTKTDDGLVINLRLTHQMIADFVGSTRVTATRLLQQLQQDGVLFCEKGQAVHLSTSRIQSNRNASIEMQSTHPPVP